MADKLDIQRKEDGEILFITLTGNITEDSPLEELKKGLKPTVVFDLSRVQRINSYGIRQWINVMKDVQSQVKQLVFHKCPPVIVEQFNMINNFGGGGLVYSVYLPYFCETCGQEETRLFALPNGTSPKDAPTLEKQTCAKCANALNFNDIEDEYFYFLQHQKDRSVDSALLERLKNNS